MMHVKERKLQILTGRAHPALAQEVADLLGVPLHVVELGEFANGEISCRLGQSVRGQDVFIMQSHTGPNLNHSIMEQAIMIDAAKRASAASITAVCPFLGYARQDRKSNGREPITARLVVDILAAAGADRIMSVDLHAGQIQGFFNGPFDHLIARPVLLEYIKKNFDTDELVIVSPDAGRVKSAERYASTLGCELAIIHKQRSTTQKNTAEAKYLIGNVEGKICVINDDMVDTAGTLCAAADLLKEKGAKEVYGVVTHGVLSDPAIDRIEASAFKQVIVTNTLPQENREGTKVISLSIGPLIANAIEAVFTGGSVSAIFGGSNQA